MEILKKDMIKEHSDKFSFFIKNMPVIKLKSLIL